MKLDRPHLNSPHQMGHVGRAQCIGSGAVGADDMSASHPIRPSVGDALLEEALAPDALWKSVQMYRPAAVAPKAYLVELCPVVGQIGLRQANLWPEHAVGAGDSHGSAAGLDLDRCGGHKRQSRAAGPPRSRPGADGCLVRAYHRTWPI